MDSVESAQVHRALSIQEALHMSGDHFISKTALPLTKGKATFQWSTTTQDADVTLKHFTYVPVLTQPDPTKQFSEELEASDFRVCNPSKKKKKKGKCIRVLSFLVASEPKEFNWDIQVSSEPSS